MQKPEARAQARAQPPGDAKGCLAWDVLDFDGPVPPGTDLEGEAAMHALAFSRAWHAVLGCVPHGGMHSRYCAGSLPESAGLDAARFAGFLARTALMPVGGHQQQLQAVQRLADTRPYVEELRAPGRLRREIVTKLCDRYGSSLRPERFDGATLARAHSEIRASADMNPMDPSRNPVTGHFLGVEPEGPFAPSRREAWRSAMCRDVLLAAQTSGGACLFLDSSASGHARSAAVLASVAAACSKTPLTILSDCPRFLREVSGEADFYHHARVVPCPDAYAAMPRLFHSFVMFGGSGARPPLCRSKERCWHYLVEPGSKASGPGGYVEVAGTVEGAMEAQRASGRLAYFVPPVLGGGGASGRARIGFHPDTVGHVTCVKTPREVPPEESHTCEIYVSCASEEGVERCMASGGVVVARDFRLVDDGVNGFLCGADGSAASVNAAVLRAVSCNAEEVGAEAARTRVLLHGEETFRWAWRGLLTRSDPVSTGSPRDAACLHERFLLLSAPLRYREWSRYRCTDALRRAVVFFDNRPDVGTALSVLVTLANLRAGWGVVGFVTRESRSFFERALGHLGDGLVLVDMPGYWSKSYSVEQYNARCKSVETWIGVAARADRCLVVQSDGLLVRRGLEEHPAMGRDYCGAPWTPHPHLSRLTRGNLVGNGGFSLRSVPEMVRVCSAHSSEAKSIYPMAPSMSEAEDVFFASRVRDPCPLADARAFSMEQLASPDALGYHRFWAYHPVEFTLGYFERLLQQTASSVPSTRAPRAPVPSPGIGRARPLRRRVPQNIL